MGENKPALPNKEAVQSSLDNALDIIDGVDLSDSECESDYEIELSDKPQRPTPNSAMRRELLKDNMEMLSKALATIDMDDDDDFSESSCEDHDDFETFGF